MLGYLCGYLRYYYPYEFLISYLNNAANDNDIENGTAYANRLGIRVTLPKWGVSRSEYFFDKEKRIIAQGLTSIKYMSSKVADELFRLSQGNQYTRFVDLLYDINEKTSVDTRQLEILIKIDYFSEFGNQRELLRISDMFYDRFKKGEAKQIKKSQIEGTALEGIVKKYSIGVTKSGAYSKNYTLLDVRSIMQEAEDVMKSAKVRDFNDIDKIQNFYNLMGYFGYITGKEEDRRKLFVLEVKPLHRKKDGKQFGYSVITKSIGSGKESRFTVFNNLYNKEPISKNDIIFCKRFERDGEYFTLRDYERII